MAFADVVSKTEGAREFGVKFYLWNAGTSDYPSFQVASNPAFQPTWDPAIVRISDVVYEMRFLADKMQIPKINFTIQNRRLSKTPSTYERFSDYFANDYTWYACACEVHMLILNGTTIESDTRWEGEITHCEYDKNTITFQATALRALERMAPGGAISLVDYAEAPKDSVGRPIPRAYGDCTVARRGAVAESDAFHKLIDRMGLNDRSLVTPAICTDLNNIDINNGPVWHFHAEQVQTAEPADAEGVYLQLPGLDEMAVFDPDTHSITTDSGGSYVSMTKTWRFWASVTPSAVDTDSNNVPNAMCMADRLYWANGVCVDEQANNVLSVRVERPPDLGYIDQVIIYAVTANPEWPAGIHFGLWDIGKPGWAGESSDMTSADAGSTYKIFSHVIPAADILFNEGFPDNMSIMVWAYGLPIYGAVTVYQLRMVVRYRPWPTVPSMLVSKIRQSCPWDNIPWADLDYGAHPQYPNADDQATHVYVACEAQRDGSGTYTGSAGTLIDQISEIIHHLISKTEAPIVGSGHGNFITARTNSFVGRTTLTSHMETRKVIDNLAWQSLLGIFPKMVSGLMRVGCVYWGDSAATNLYPTPIHFDHVLECKIDSTDVSRIRNAFYLGCHYDHAAGKCSKMVYCDNTSSDDGTGTDDYTEKSKLSTSESDYGRHEMHRQAFAIKDTDAVTLRNRLADMLYQPRVRLKLKTDWTYYDLEAGHVIEIDNDSFYDAGHLYPGKTGGSAGKWSYGGTTRYFWVERVSISDKNYMEIEASEGVWS